MGDMITALQNTPVPTILVVGGIVFLFLAVVGQFAGQIQVPPKRQKWAGIVGVLLLFSGVALYVVPPVPPTVPTPTPTIVTGSTPSTSTPTAMLVVSTEISIREPTDTPIPEPTDTPEPPTNTPSPPTDTPVPVQPTPTPPTWTDDFDGMLGSGWSWTNEDSTHWSLTDVPGSLRIVTQGDSLVSALTSGFAPLNLLLREAPTGNFEIVTRVSFRPVANIQQAAIVILQDNNNFVKLNKAYVDLESSVGNGIYFDVAINGEYQWDALVMTPFPNDITYLKLRRAGTTFIGFYSADGVKWTESGRATVLLTPTKVGIMADNAGSDAAQIPADFDFFSVIER